MHIDKISKEEFDTVYNFYPPNRWINFMFKYFSRKTTKEDSKYKKVLTYSIFGLFFCGLIGTIAEAPKFLIGVFFVSMSILLISLVIGSFIAFVMNQYRIIKICKELNISKTEYNLLVNLYNY